MNILITAGATRNPIDSMRYISANSSGRTGVEILSLLDENPTCNVQFFCSEEASARASSGYYNCQTFGSTRDLFSKMKGWVESNPDGVIIHAAAVGDYEVAKPSMDEKIPSGREITLKLSPTPKIANKIRKWGFKGMLITFKAAAPESTSPELVMLGTKQLVKTGSDFVFANIIGKTDSDVYLIEENDFHCFNQRSDGIDNLVQRVGVYCEQENLY